MARTANSKNGAQGFFDATQAFGDFRVPGFDVQAIVESQRKNLEAFTQANQLAAEGVQAVARRQVEIVQQAFADVSGLFREWTQPGAPQERLAKNAEVAKAAFEKSLANARELAELATKANTEAFNVISSRFTESLEEVSDYTKKHAAAE
jgi:phasin family protein